MVLNIPESGMLLESSANTTTELPSQAFAIALSGSVIEDMIACVQNGGDIQLALGSNPVSVATPASFCYCRRLSAIVSYSTLLHNSPVLDTCTQMPLTLLHEMLPSCASETPLSTASRCSKVLTISIAEIPVRRPRGTDTKDLRSIWLRPFPRRFRRSLHGHETTESHHVHL
jgi:hypothetical protein